jgi:hypothetical protein
MKNRTFETMSYVAEKPTLSHRFVPSRNQSGDAINPDQSSMLQLQMLKSDDGFDGMVEKVAFHRYSSSKLTRSNSCSSIDLDWTFLWNVDDHNAKVERHLIKEGGSKPRKPDESYVCFKKWNHPGTVLWRKVVKSLANNVDEYPEWRDEIYDLVRIQLHQTYGIRQFLVCCDSNGEPSKKTNGCWYLATAKEILDRTKQRFADERKAKAISRSLTDNINQSESDRPRKRQRLSDGRSSPVSLAEVEDAMFNLEEALANFRDVVEKGHVSNRIESELKSPAFVENLHWMNQLVDDCLLPLQTTDVPSEYSTEGSIDDASCYLLP